MSTYLTANNCKVLNFISDKVRSLKVMGKFDKETEGDIIDAIYEGFGTMNKRNPYIRDIGKREKDNNKTDKILSDDIPVYELDTLKNAGYSIFNDRNILLLRHEASIKDLAGLDITDRSVKPLLDSIIKLLRS